MTAPGRFVTFEGGEGAGKSTQLARLADRLEALGLAVVRTREPGGTRGAEEIRRLLVEGGPARWSAMSECMLLQAARHDHVARRIAPALAAGSWVLCDRFTDSTRVYQGIAGALGLELVDRLHQIVLGELAPDLTLVLDVPPALGLERRRGAAESRFERKAQDYHERVRQGFLAIARAEPARCVVIDGRQAEDAVAEAVRSAVAGRFGLDLGGR
jgi:dTMP kinase